MTRRITLAIILAAIAAPAPAAAASQPLRWFHENNRFQALAFMHQVSVNGDKTSCRLDHISTRPLGPLYPGDKRGMVETQAANTITCYRNGPAATGISHHDLFVWKTDGQHTTLTFSRMGDDGKYHILRKARIQR